MIPLGPSFAQEVLDGGAAAFGVLMTALGFGAAIGVVTLLWLQKRLPRVAVFCFAVIGTGGFLVLAASVSSLAPAAFFIGGVGACAGTTYVTGFTLLQENVSDELRGRTFATLYTVVRLCLLDLAHHLAVVGRLLELGHRGPVHRPDRHHRAVQLRAPGRAHRALGRRDHHVRRRVGGVALDPQGGAARGGEWRGAADARRDRSNRSGRSAWSSRHRWPSRSSRDIEPTDDDHPKPGRRRDPRAVRRARRRRRQRQEHAGGAARAAGCARRASTVRETFEPGAGATGAVIRELLLHGPESIDAGRRGAAHGGRPRAARRHRDRARAGARRVGRVRPVRAVVARVPGGGARARRRAGRGAQRGRDRRGSSPIS